MQDTLSLLRKYGFHPRKSLGQNFLIDSTAPHRIAESADLTADDTVLEIGAGLGALTYELGQRCHRVYAVETDPHLVAILQHELAPYKNIKIVEKDILKLDPASVLDMHPPSIQPQLWGSLIQNYVVVANLPYYITAAVMRHIFESTIRPDRMVVTVQREVAQRMIAQPGEMSLLSISTQFYSLPRIVMRLKRGAFSPPPKVESAVVRMDLYDNPPVVAGNIELFFDIVKAGFSQKRKQLRNSLAAGLHLHTSVIEKVLAKCEVDHTRRAETLSLEEWSGVYQSLSSYIGHSP
jgi:16S rRNA (adenine1518-N6/adenine1519-N6)-dimethyltransferase